MQQGNSVQLVRSTSTQNPSDSLNDAHRAVTQLLRSLLPDCGKFCDVDELLERLNREVK
ncbi:MAG: hypothetical protein MHPSP_001866, partial [Paramarteilia canceri]